MEPEITITTFGWLHGSPPDANVVLVHRDMDKPVVDRAPSVA